MNIARWGFDRNQLIEVLKIVSWPFVGLIVAVIAIVIFRKPITRLLNRLKRVGVPGVKLELEAAVAGSVQAESEPVKTGLDAETENRLRQVRNVDVPSMVQEQQNLIRADLRKLGVAQQEQVELLVKHLAVTQLLLRAEYTYRLIFGSQIALLKFLNASVNGTRPQLSEFYEGAKEQFPQLYETYSFEQYLQFLLAQGLVKTEDHQRYSITVAGQEFLRWMPVARVVENKPF